MRWLCVQLQVVLVKEMNGAERCAMSSTLLRQRTTHETAREGRGAASDVHPRPLAAMTLALCPVV